MSFPKLFIEGCAGSAAVWLASKGAKPPLHYRGGKSRYAKEILEILHTWAGPWDRTTLNEPGAWGRFWLTLKNHRPLLVERLLSTYVEGEAKSSPKDLWESITTQDDLGLCYSPYATATGTLVAGVCQWLVLQRYSYAGKPVDWQGRWLTHGFLGAAADRASQRARALARGNQDAKRWAKSSPGLADLAGALCTLPVPDVVSCSRLQDLLPVANALLYIDPPYDGTNAGYLHPLDRYQVLEIVERWRRAGSRVAISEAEPIMGISARHVRLGSPKGGGRTSSKQQEEWLTLFEPLEKVS